MRSRKRANAQHRLLLGSELEWATWQRDDRRSAHARRRFDASLMRFLPRYREVRVPTYVSLLRYTQQGIMDAKNSPARLDAAKEGFRRAGAELKGFYLTMGQYDGVAILEAPDDVTAARLALGIATQGNLRLETLRAFSEAEYRKIVASLP